MLRTPARVSHATSLPTAARDARASALRATERRQSPAAAANAAAAAVRRQQRQRQQRACGEGGQREASRSCRAKMRVASGDTRGPRAHEPAAQRRARVFGGASGRRSRVRLVRDCLGRGANGRRQRRSEAPPGTCATLPDGMGDVRAGLRQQFGQFKLFEFEFECLNNSCGSGSSLATPPHPRCTRAPRRAGPARSGRCGPPCPARVKTRTREAARVLGAPSPAPPTLREAAQALQTSCGSLGPCPPARPRRTCAAGRHPSAVTAARGRGRGGGGY